MFTVENKKVVNLSTQYQAITERRVIGFSGAHQTGKMITAIRVASDFGYQFLPTSIEHSSVWTHVNSSDCLTFGERIQVQEMLLLELKKVLSIIDLQDKTCFVTDKTPIDILAYLLANIDNTTSSIFDERVEKFIDQCIEMCSIFTHFIVIQPGIHFIETATQNKKAHNSKIYQETLTSIIIGSYHRYYERLGTDKILIEIPNSVVNINERIKFIREILKIF